MLEFVLFPAKVTFREITKWRVQCPFVDVARYKTIPFVDGYDTWPSSFRCINIVVDGAYNIVAGIDTL
jgi:hypothetical protein